MRGQQLVLILVLAAVVVEAKHRLAAHRSCNKETEFECQADSRCIPREWRCDFTEQCSDGQDEWGCAMERCNFERDLCNWRNRLAPDPSPSSPIEAEILSGELPPKTGSRQQQQQTAWRRFFFGGGDGGSDGGKTSSGSRFEAWLKGLREKGQNLPPENSIKSRRTAETTATARTNLMLLRQLELLGSELLSRMPQQLSTPLAERTPASTSQGAKVKFAFVPLLLPGSGGDARAGEQHSKIASTAQLSTPLISQTNSMCQLRFKYSLWTLAEQQHSASSLELRLLARDRSTGGERLLWSDSSSRRDQPAAGWQLEVVELGHEREIELYFRAVLSRANSKTTTTSIVPPPTNLVATTTTTTSTTTATKQTNKERNLFSEAAKSRGSSDYPETSSEEPAIAAGLVGLSWLEFSHCGWPQGAQCDLYEQQQQQRQQRQEEDLELEEALLGDEFLWLGRPADVATAAMRSEPRCPRGKFACPQSGLCIDAGKLCNFVDDCMSAFSQQQQQQSRPADSDQEQLELASDDESPRGVCALVPGMEDFEPAPANPTAKVSLSHFIEGRRVRRSARNHENTKTKTKKRLFWSLVEANWPRDKIKLQRATINNSGDGRQPPNQASTSHLPRKDHTTRLRRRPAGSGVGVGGHYLALEMASAINSAGPISNQTQGDQRAGAGDIKLNQATAAHWVHLESPWLRRRRSSGSNSSSAPEDQDCRVKFFYNLVRGGQRKATPLPFNLYLIVEHVVMPRRHETGEVAQPKLDALIYLRPTDLPQTERQAANSISWPGVDFWREFNRPLSGLSHEDIFYIRITLMVEHHQADAANEALVSSFSFDDLSTHTGCELASRGLDARFQREADQRYRLDGSQMPRLENIINVKTGDQDSATRRQRRRQMNLRQRSIYQHLRLDIEPRRLILSVLGALLALFGFIFMIVFVVVPHVERAVISFYDQLLPNNMQEMDDTPRNSMIAIVSSRDTPLLQNPYLTHQPSHHRRSRRRRLSVCSLSQQPLAAQGEVCELTTNGGGGGGSSSADWDHLTATSGGLRWRYLTPPAPTQLTTTTDNQQLMDTESYLTSDSLLTVFDSDSYSQRLSSVGDSYCVLKQQQSDNKTTSSENYSSSNTSDATTTTTTTTTDENALICDKNNDDGDNTSV